MKQNIRILKDQHKGKDIWAVAGGPSMNFIHPSFFDNKLVVGVNLIHSHFPCTFVVAAHIEDGQGIIDAGQTLVTPEYDCGEKYRHRDGEEGEAFNDFDGDYFFFHTMRRPSKQPINLAPLDMSDTLVFGGSTVTPAIHFAYFLGAKNIIICGHDCAFLDMESHQEGYYDGYWPSKDAVDKYEQKVSKKFVKWEKVTLVLVTELRKRGVNVHSLNPFINLNLEGHKVSRGK